MPSSPPRPHVLVPCHEGWVSNVNFKGRGISVGSVVPKLPGGGEAELLPGARQAAPPGTCSHPQLRLSELRQHSTLPTPVPVGYQEAKLEPACS